MVSNRIGPAPPPRPRHAAVRVRTVLEPGFPRHRMMVRALPIHSWGGNGSSSYVVVFGEMQKDLEVLDVVVFFPAVAAVARRYGATDLCHCEVGDLLPCRFARRGRLQGCHRICVFIMLCSYLARGHGRRHRICMFYAPPGASFKKAKSVLIAKVDCDEHKSVCSKYGVSGYPTIQWFPKSMKDSALQKPLLNLL